jgi:hypothetical protein
MEMKLGMIPYWQHRYHLQNWLGFVMSHIALNHLVYSKTSVRNIQKLYTRKIESSQPITEDPQLEVSTSSEVISGLDTNY